MSGEIAPSQYGVIVLAGYGISIAVERGHLILTDGIGAERRRGRFSRITKSFKRLLVLGHSGFISFEAARWLSDAGIEFAQIDHDANLLLTSSGYGRDDAALRRAQSLAIDTASGVDVMRLLLTRKIERQSTVAAPYSAEASANIAALRDDMLVAPDMMTMRGIEATAAALYWPLFAALPFPFSSQDMKKVPEHWKTVGNRASPITNSPQKAVTPFHAMLNYLYALLHIETSVAALTMGLDPGIGILHNDLLSRRSFALDLEEPARPDVDKWLLSTIATRSFRAADFVETREGVCRLQPTTARQLADTLPLWRFAVAPIVEDVAALLLTDAPTVLTGRKRGAARPERNGEAKPRSQKSITLPRLCKRCNTPIAKGRRSFCSDACCLMWRREQAAQHFQASSRAGANASDIHRARISATNRERAAERATWNGGEADEEMYRREILPGLSTIPLARLMNATGLSLRYCALIRKGAQIPHPRFWAPLRELVL
jgi:CRISPR-associated endonuclease Cas1